MTLQGVKYHEHVWGIKQNNPEILKHLRFNFPALYSNQKNNTISIIFMQPINVSLESAAKSKVGIFNITSLQSV